MTERIIVVVNCTGEPTVAIVSCQKNETIQSARDLQDQIARAVTEWVKNTEAGKEAWKQSSEDFNIGDLSLCLGNEELLALLKKNNVIDIEIETYCQGHDWDFDMILVRGVE